MFTLLHRAFKLCSSFEFYNQEIVKLKTIFENNAPPKLFVDFCVKKYIDKAFMNKKVVLKVFKKELIASFLLFDNSHYNTELVKVPP